jgi:maltooligosyltrehalose trehalohydrolase
MGEDWAASTPFLFFVDFDSDPTLATAVREGRRREFARFKAFADPDMSALIPDPTQLESFLGSRLDWEEVSRAPHAAVREETRRLLELRRAEILPLTRSAFQGSSLRRPGPRELDITWRYAGGTLRLLANFGEADASYEAEGMTVVWGSPAATRSGETLHLPSWSGMVLRGEPA